MDLYLYLLKLGTAVYGNLSDFLMKLNRLLHVEISTAFSRFLVLRMHTGRTHPESGQPFHMHPDSDYNLGYLQPSL